ncbi:hypothetical protein O181_078326 [Austropuccinia psidii MF-1]|uniref:Uncharacterized protein n=1 Tax=Austropuccinia psidii MF-1 TaxID=1389203 RepID=A0A9Q3FJU0_9BASI|nr:hypothetical protein [Austropuccinia psidii MF-1]
MLTDKHTRNACSFSNPSNHTARGDPAQDALVRTPLLLMMIIVFPSRNGPQDPKQADGNDSGRLALFPKALICPHPLIGHHLIVASLLDWSKVIIRPMKDGNGKRTFELGPIVTISSHPWDSNAKNKTHLIPPDKTHPFNVCLASKPRSNPLLARVAPDEPSQHHQPPIPGPSPCSKPPEDIATHEPKPEVAPTKSMEELFARPATPRLVIIIDDMPVRSPTTLPLWTPVPPPLTPTPVPFLDIPPIAAKNPTASSPPVPSSSHSYDDACQEFREELNSLFAQALEAHPKEEITGIVSKYLEK